MSANHDGRRRLGRKTLPGGLVCLAVIVATGVWLVRGDRISDLARQEGVQPLTDSQMKAISGGFTMPKARRVCTVCNMGAYGIKCYAGQSGAAGTLAPSIEPNTGNLNDRVLGPSVGANGGGVGLIFRYDSDMADGTNSALNLSTGYGWIHNYDSSLMESGPDMRWIQGDGRISHFDGGPLGFRAMSDEFAVLSATAPGEFEIRTVSGTVHRFDRAVSGPWPGVRHLLSRTTDANGRATTFEYDALDRLVRVSDHFGNELRFEYDGASSRLVRVIDPLGRQTLLEYDPEGIMLARIVHPDGTAIAYQYNARRQMIRKSVQDPCPPPLSLHEGDFDGDGDVDGADVTVFVGCLGGPGAAVPAECTPVDLDGDDDVDAADFARLQLAVADSVAGAPPYGCPSTEEFTVEYDSASGGAESIRDLDGDQLVSIDSDTGWEVDHAQSLITGEMTYAPGTSTVADGRGNVWSVQYDERGFMTQLAAPLVDGQAAVTTYEYDAATLRISRMVDPLGRETSYEYDAHGNTTKITDAMGNVTSNGYGHPTITELLTRRVDPDGSVWTYEYDAAGNLLREIDPLVETPTDAIITYEYDGTGRQTRMADRNGHVTTYEYDALSRLTRTTVDPGGLDLTSQYEYDAVGNLTASTDPRGIATVYQYDARDRQIGKTRDPGGLDLTMTYQYDGRDNQTAMTNPRGLVTQYEYDHRDRLTQTTDALGQVTTSTYDGNGNRVTEVDANGTVTLYEYDARNRLSKQVEDFGSDADDLNATTRYQYDAADNRVRTVREVDPEDGSPRVTEYQYDSVNRLVRETADPGGLNITTQYEYAPPGGAACGCSGTPGSSQVHKTIDAEGKLTYFYYDTLDRNTSVVRKIGDTDDNEGDADDAISRTVYDPVGNVLETRVENDPDPDLVTTSQYDEADRQIQTRVDPGGADLVSTYEYDGNGNLTRETRPNGNVTSNGYDSADRRTSSSDSLGKIDSLVYDANGNMLIRKDGNDLGNSVENEFDAIDRVTTRYDALDRPTAYEYDSLGHVTRTIDRNGNVTSNGYDGAYRMIREVRAEEALDIVTEYRYDDLGSLRTVTAHNVTGGSPELQVTEYEYDAAGRRTREIYADDEDGRPRDVLYVYDGVGNVLTRTDQNRDVTQYQYDDLHRRVERSYTLDPGSPTYPPVQLPDAYVYDRASQMRSAEHQYDAPNPDVVLTYTYDGVGRIVTMTQDGRAIAYSYEIDPATNRREITYPSGRIVREDYDQRDRLATVTDQPTGAVITEYDYDPGDRRTHVQNGNATTTDWSYNDNNWTTRITHANLGGPFIDFEYDHDAEGNPLFARHNHAPDASEWYRYDAAERLIDFKRGTLAPDGSDVVTFTPLSGQTQRRQWTLDQVGNWPASEVRRDDTDTCEERFTDKVNELVGIQSDQTCPPPGGAPVAFDYDDNGNLRDDQTAGAGAVGLRYEYDVENRLNRVTRLGDSAVIAEYSYDARDRRIRKVVTNSGSLDGTTEFLVNERWQTLADYDGSGVLLNEYVYGRSVDDHVTLDRNLDGDGTAVGAGDARYFYHADPLGSVRGLTGAASDLEEGYGYDLYGAPIVYAPGPDGEVDFGDDDVITLDGISGLANAYLFTGRLWDAETGVYDYRARFHDARLGRFLQRDPVVTRDGEGCTAMNASANPTFCSSSVRYILNRYDYVGAMPTSRIDPFGEIEWPTLARFLDVADKKVGAVEPWPNTGKFGINYEATTRPAGNRVGVWAPNDNVDGGWRYWCHGFTFGGSGADFGPFSPYSGPPTARLLADEWEEIRCVEARAGNIAAWYDGTSPNHSAIFTEVATANGKLDEDRSKMDTKNGNAALRRGASVTEINGVYGKDYKCYKKKVVLDRRAMKDLADLFGPKREEPTQKLFPLKRMSTIQCHGR